jgi:metallo-beta-lactamase class B
MLCLSASAYAQQAAGPETVEAFQGQAKVEAGLNWAGTFLRLCIPPAPATANVAPATVAVAPAPPQGAGVAGGAVPPRETWYAEPAQVFDNLYYLGSQSIGSWALVTSDGIIIIDTLAEYATEDELFGGMEKLGLDVNDIKYVLISHSHGIGDHDGGARVLQDRVPGVRVVMSAADWNALEASTRGGFSMWGKPARDIEATDGQEITLGDTTVRILTTPGHTPGTISFIFDVTDNGEPHTVAYTGGTALNFAADPAYYETYVASTIKMGEAAAAAGADVFMSNHSEFDNSFFRSRAVLARGPDDVNAFVVGEQEVQDYYAMAGNCARAGLARILEK